MNWLERARGELQEKALESAANTAKGTSTAVTAVRNRAEAEGWTLSAFATCGSHGMEMYFWS